MRTVSVTFGDEKLLGKLTLILRSVYIGIHKTMPLSVSALSTWVSWPSDTRQLDDDVKSVRTWSLVTSSFFAIARRLKILVTRAKHRIAVDFNGWVVVRNWHFVSRSTVEQIVWLESPHSSWHRPLATVFVCDRELWGRLSWPHVRFLAHVTHSPLYCALADRHPSGLR